MGETLKKDFAECGEIDRFNMPMNEEGRPRGIASITYKSEEGVTKALEFNETDYGGRTLKVNKASDRPAKGKDKDGKGKDGKGKGKDGKGKGKKGKKGGLSSEKKAAKDGAMVEGTGKKQTFDDSEEEEAPPPAKKAKKAPKEEADEEAAEPPAKKAKKAKKVKPPTDSDDDE